MTKKAFQSFAKDHPKNGGQVVVNEDELFADDHEYVKWWPNMFGEHEDLITVQVATRNRPVEQATAAPGEKRLARKS